MKSIDTLLLFVWHSCHSCIAQNIEKKKEYFQKLSLYKNIFDTIVFTQRKHLNPIYYLLKSNCPPFLIINERHSAFKFSHWCHLPTSWVVNALVSQHRTLLVSHNCFGSPRDPHQNKPYPNKTKRQNNNYYINLHSSFKQLQ